MTRQSLLIDADDTLWENNVHFEEAFDQFVDGREACRGVRVDLGGERERSPERGQGISGNTMPSMSAAARTLGSQASDVVYSGRSYVIWKRSCGQTARAACGVAATNANCGPFACSAAASSRAVIRSKSPP